MNIFSSAFAVEGKPMIRRICLNRSNGEVTIIWNRPTDNCGSFTHLRIYGREDAISPFILVGTLYNINTTSYVYTLPNLKNWQFYISYSKTCNGIDSILTDTVTIDSKEPELVVIDSVSVNQSTQKTMIGWELNPDNDTKGYFVYNILPGNNQLVSDTGSTFYIDYKFGKPNQGSVKYAIAAYDSCGNTSPIGSFHSTVYLTSTLDICDKTVDLNWTDYVGWPSVGSYDILVNKNNTGYTLQASVGGNVLNYLFVFNNFGDDYCFIIRAHKQGSTFTSSSNTVCQNTRSVINPNKNYLANVTVNGSSIDLTYLFDNTSSAVKLYLLRKTNNGMYIELANFSAPLNTFYTYNDLNVDIQKNVYTYVYAVEGPCGLGLDSSNKSNSILLNLNSTNSPNNLLTWNQYNYWLTGVDKYELLFGDSYNFNSSTWNVIGSFVTNQTDYADFREIIDIQKPVCYCVRAIEKQINIYNRKDTSYSNITCINGEPSIYFPNAFQYNGFNNTFYPIGAFIDYSKSNYSIYNRWGQKVFETNDLRVPWKGLDKNGNDCQQDLYVYYGKVTGLNGTILNVNGTVSLLK